MFSKRSCEKLLFTFFLTLIFSSCSLLPPLDRPILEVRESNALSDQEELTQDLVLPDEPLTLDEIVAIVLERNLDALVKAYEYQVQREVLTGEQLRMLPNLILDLQGSDRNRNTGSFSKSLDPTIPPAPPSISLDRSITQYTFDFVYNLLDFGLAYYKSRVETNNTWIKAMEYERIRQNLVLDVYKQYWKAVVAKSAVDKGKIILEKSRKEIQAFQEQKDLKTISLLLMWRAQDRLLRIQKQVFFYQKEYHTALYALGLMMALPSCLEFEIAPPDLTELPPDLGNPCCFVDIALRERPELFGNDFQESIAVDEARSAILQMFPSLEVTLGTNYNSNSFLIFNHWLSVGYRSIWNLLAIPRHAAERDVARWKRALAVENRINITAGIMSQVYLSTILYKDNLDEFELASQINKTNVELYNAASAEYEVGKLSHPDLLEFESQAYQAEIDVLQAYGGARIALEQINNSIGIPLMFQPDRCKKIIIPSHNMTEKSLNFVLEPTGGENNEP